MNLKSNMKSGISVLQYYLFNKRTPLSVILAVISKCNFHCKYCRVVKPKKSDMSTEQILSLLDQMADAGTQRISFTGGEPLLRDDMGKIVNYAKKKGLYVTLSSNGSFLPEKMDDVKNVDALILTLDGSSAHDKYRKKGSYNQLINAIKLVKANNINVWTTTVLNNHSINDIDEILRFAKELDIKTYFAPLMQIPKLTGVIDELFPTIEKQKESINKIIKRKKEGYPILNSYDFLYYINKWPD